MTRALTAGVNAWSIAMWMKAVPWTTSFYTEGYTGSTSPLMLLQYGTPNSSGSARLYLRDSGGVTICDSSTTGAVLNATPTWRHLAVTCSGATAGTTATCHWYIDGAQDSSFTFTAQPLTNNGGFNTNTATIGALNRNGAVSSFMNGSESDVRLYNRALTAGEVGSLYRATQRI